MLKRNKKFLRLVMLSSISISLNGCSWFSSNNDGDEGINDSYIQSKEGESLQIPADIQELSIRDSYKVPQGVAITNRQAKGRYLSLEPPQLLFIAGDGVREDSDAKHPTVWIRNRVDVINQYFKTFVEQQNISLQNIDERSFSTNWISDQDGGLLAKTLGFYNIDGQRHKLMLKIIAESGTEIAVQATHLQSQKVMNSKWENVEVSNRVAKQFLNQFIVFYDSELTRLARERIIQEGSIATRLGVDANSNIAIVSERDFQTIWSQLANVLKYLNLEIDDRDQSTGIYYFTVPEKSGFWGSIFGGSSDDAKVELFAGSYQIEVKALPFNKTSMTFKDESGALLNASIVSSIYPEFSAAFRSRSIRK